MKKRMSRSKWLFLAACICFSFMSFLSAAEDNRAQLALLGAGGEPIIPPPGLTTRISLDLRNIDVLEALKFLSMKSGMNIVPTQKVAGRVTLTVENVPVQDVFDIMLRSNSLAYEKKGEIYNVMSETEYKILNGKNFYDARQVKVFRLKYAAPEQAFSILDAVKSDIGRLLVEPESGTVLILDTPEKIAQAQKALDTLEQKGTIKVFSLKYANARDAEKQLKNYLEAKGVGTVKADETNNQLIVQTLPERMKDIESLINSLDKKTKEVLIDIKIIKIRLSNQLDSGVEWEGLFGLANSRGLSYLGSYPFSAVQAATDIWRSRTQVLSDMGDKVGSYPFSGTTTNYAGGSKVKPGEQLHVGMIDGKRDFDVLIKYLQTLGKTKILSNPSIAVTNNQEARVHVGERRAYVTTTTTTGSTTNTVSEAVTYIDVGVQLFLTPTINDEGYVSIKIRPEISSIVGNITTSSNNLVPIIDTSTAETTVMAKDGATIMLGGLGGEEKTEDTEGLPGLSRIPFLGAMFRSTTKSTVRTELIIMLTPNIFGGDRFITAKDKENEKFGIKQPKKFDVFKPEAQEEGAVRVEALSNTTALTSKENTPPANESAVTLPLGQKDLVPTKGLKLYGDSSNRINSEALIFKNLAASEKNIPITKGFKNYNTIE